MLAARRNDSRNQDSFQTWDSNFIPDNHLDAKSGYKNKDYSKGERASFQKLSECFKAAQPAQALL